MTVAFRKQFADSVHVGEIDTGWLIRFPTPTQSNLVSLPIGGLAEGTSFV